MKDNFLNNTYKWVSWITVIDSNKPGKNIAICAITHWNEPVWIDIFNYLMETYEISKKLKKWKIFLIAVNLQAYNSYQSDKDISKHRFIDFDMNRISNKKWLEKCYEFYRLQELKSIFSEIDVAIDLHSVPKGDDVIWLTDEKFLDSAKVFFDVENILVDNMGNTWALIWELIRNGKEAYGLECWNHLWENAMINGINNIMNFLQYFWSIEKFKYTSIFKRENIFQFFKEVVPETENFEYAQDFLWFTHISNNSYYAKDWDLEVINSDWENIYLWIVAKYFKKWVTAWFLFKKLN